MKRFGVVFLKGCLAGASIGVGGLAFCLLSFAFRDIMNPFLKIVPAASFSIGLMLVCFLSFFLCTGKAGFALNPLFLRNDKTQAKSNLIDLLIMILGNIVGAAALGILFGLVCLPFEEMRFFLGNVAAGKILGDDFVSGYLKAFALSLACGALVYLAVFLFRLFHNPILKAIGILIPIGLFVYFGFHHCVANVFYYAASLSFDYRFVTYFLVVMVGNFISAFLLNLLFLLLRKIGLKFLEPAL